jgi:oligopeptide transport system substrate-binding protein
MKHIIVFLFFLFIVGCAGGTQAAAAAPEIVANTAAAVQVTSVPPQGITPAIPTAETLPGKEVIPISKMAAKIPWLPLDENAIPITTFIGINSSVPPFDNPLVRKAFSQAIDRQNISTGDKNRGRNSSVPATTFIPPQVLGRDLYQAVGLDFDQASAKKALSDAGFADISKFPKVDIVFYEGSADLIKAYQNMWKNTLGVEVTLVPVKSGEELSKAISVDKPGLFILGTWIADSNDPDNFTYDAFLGLNNSYPKFPDSKFADIITKARSEAASPVERQQLYIEAEKILCEDGVYVIPVTHALISK